MMRTQIQLPEEDYERLRKVAIREGRSMADCIREGIALFLAKERARDSDLMEIAGRFPARPGHLKDHDRWWAEAALPSNEEPTG